MKITIHYYGRLIESAGREKEDIVLSTGNTLAVLERVLSERYPDFSNIPLTFFSNSRICETNFPLNEGMSIECMPPFSGG